MKKQAALSAHLLFAFSLTITACSSEGTRASPDASSPHDGGGGPEAAPPSDDATAPADASSTDSWVVEEPIAPDAMPPKGTFCSLPGSLVFTAQGPRVVPGGTPLPDLGWLTLPAGFCAHYFGSVAYARQLRFAPGGELFVASPKTGTTSVGAPPADAIGGVAVLPDDDHDGVADMSLTFVSGLSSIQGLLFANGTFYFQDDTTIRSVPYKAGDRQPSASPQPVTTMKMQQAGEHWPKVMDQAKDGTIYITNGGSQADACLSTWPIRGSIFSLGSGGATTLVSMGYRNPIALRCETKHNVCLATELALDYSMNRAGREKLVPVRPGDNWGYPCCATQGTPYSGVSYEDGGVPDCSHVAADTDSFVIGHTPFGLDFETGAWPAPWADRVFVTLHGEAGGWGGARVIAIALDPNTGLPLPGTELPGDSGPNTLLEFATGWDDGSHAHGRPTAVTFAPDGRMFLGDDQKGLIFWIAPFDLQAK